MKRADYSFAQHGGFTLIELIVVIAILATLAGISYPAIMAVQDNARISASSKACMDIVSGVSSFKQDSNGMLPFYTKEAKPDRDDQIYLSTLPGKNAGLLSILTGYEEDEDDKLNRNNEAYIKPSKAEDPRDGLYGESAAELGLYDPWGKPYYIVLCEMDDGCIDPFTGKRIRRENCLVYGLGPDGEGIAPPHSDKPARKKIAKGGKQSKAARRAAREAAEEEEEAIQDNIFSWKKKAKK